MVRTISERDSPVTSAGSPDTRQSSISGARSGTAAATAWRGEAGALVQAKNRELRPPVTSASSPYEREAVSRVGRQRRSSQVLVAVGGAGGCAEPGCWLAICGDCKVRALAAMRKWWSRASSRARKGGRRAGAEYWTRNDTIERKRGPSKYRQRRLAACAGKLEDGVTRIARSPTGSPLRSFSRRSAMPGSATPRGDDSTETMDRASPGARPGDHRFEI